VILHCYRNLFLSIFVCLFESFFDFPVISRFSHTLFELDSIKGLIAHFDRMLVYRQLSASIAKFCVSVGEIESSLRGNVPSVFAKSDSYWFKYQRNLITEDVVYVTSHKYSQYIYKHIEIQKGMKDTPCILD